MYLCGWDEVRRIHAKNFRQSSTMRQPGFIERGHGGVTSFIVIIIRIASRANSWPDADKPVDTNVIFCDRKEVSTVP